MTHYRATCTVTISVDSEWVRADTDQEAEAKIRRKVFLAVTEKLATPPTNISVGRLQTFTVTEGETP